MKKKISCCGMICSECGRYQNACEGCPESNGKTYWLEYAEESTCAIYRCCIMTKHYPHCGKCTAFPCNHYDLDDPAKTVKENEAAHRRQKELLKQREMYNDF